ncbi:hypothetical protein SLA2020_027530 [Shorea laevis]
MAMRSRKAAALWMAPSKIWLLAIYFLMLHYGKSRVNSARQKRASTMVDDRRHRRNSQQEINYCSIRVYSGDELEEERDKKRERKNMLERRRPDENPNENNEISNLTKHDVPASEIVVALL